MMKLKVLQNVFNEYILIDIYENGNRIFAGTIGNIPTELENCVIVTGDIINNRIDCEVTK